MKFPKITVVVPSYNKIKYIRETLDSLLSQKYPNLEVIIQDCGSTDWTLAVIKEYAQTYPEIIKWESKKDNGQLDAINLGLSKAKGEIVSYLNADDALEKFALIEVGKYFSQNPKTLWLAGKAKVVDEDGKEIVRLVGCYKNFLMKLNRNCLLLFVNYLMQPAVFLTKRAYQKYGPFAGTCDFVMEYDLWLRLAKAQMPAVLNISLAKFRIEKNAKTWLMHDKLLQEDEKLVKKYTKSCLIFFVHKLHNWLRTLVVNYLQSRL